LRIAVLSPFIDRRHGTERAVAELVERLAAKYGHEIHLYSHRAEDLQVSAEPNSSSGWKAGIYFHRVPRLGGPLLFDFPFWILMNRLCRVWDSRRGIRFDVVFSPGINALDADIVQVHVVFQRLAELQSGRKERGLRALHRSFYYALLCFLERRVYRRKSLRLAVVSPHTAKQMAQYFAREDLQITPYGVDFSHFSCSARLALRREARSKLQYSSDDVVVLLIGNDLRNKGLPVLLEALNLLRDLPWKLCVVGSDATAEFQGAIARMNFEKRVHFCPETSDILSFYAAADIYTAPSLEDSFNLPVLEAMACGVPVLVSVKAGVSEFLADGVDGILLTEPENAELLAKKLSGLLPGNEQGRELREKLGASGEKKARTFTWDRHAELVEDILVTMKR
jgi:glycosyltransferase involved in cell wall biosynthesis